jgi:hypothetical protein
MINKIYKIIHNKYSTLFEFIFYIRYLFGIFFVATALFLIIPYFFNYKKNDEVIKNYLLENYDLHLNTYEDIKYSFIPQPKLKINNVDLSIKNNLIKADVKHLIIYPKLLGIYNYENFSVDKIILNKNNILFSDQDLKILIKYIYKLRNKLMLKNSDLKISIKKMPLINIEKVYFSNYGFNKNTLKGELFNKKFKILVSDNYNKIDFKLFKTGIAANINFNEINNQTILSGIFKSKLLNSKLKFNFEYDDHKVKIYNSYFRNKNLVLNNESTVIYRPFLSLNSIINVEDINLDLLKNINLKEMLNKKNLIKKINTNNQIKFKPKKFNRNIIDGFDLKINLAYGRLNYLKKMSIKENVSTCKGDVNFLEEYPILYFDCLLITSDKKKFLKLFSIKYKKENELLNLHAKGNINLLSKKINFKKILVNEDYKASKEDLNYFKQIFESVFFKKDFSAVLNSNKIKEFILKIN